MHPSPSGNKYVEDNIELVYFRQKQLNLHLQRL
jgi:hypothetical protein